MVAAAGIALGALLGAAIPSTATEQRYLGKTSAGLTDKVKQTAREGFEAVRDTVTKTTDHADAPTAGQAEMNSTPNGQQRTASEGPADLSRGMGTS